LQPKTGVIQVSRASAARVALWGRCFAVSKTVLLRPLRRDGEGQLRVTPRPCQSVVMAKETRCSRGLRFVCLCILASCGVLAQSQSPQSLAEVKTIFVDSFGHGEWATIIRDKIINRLAASDRFQIVLDSDKADAILTGSGDVSKTDSYDNGSGGTRWDATAVVRLITRDQHILWVSEAKNNRFARSASSSVADHIVKDLLKAALPSKKKK
jgi:hypothetical protein